MDRTCPACRTALVRRDGETQAHFLRRTYCDHRCSVADRSRKSAEAGNRPDVAELEEFTPAEILRAARTAAPRVPVPMLAAVLRAVEPLIASNARRRLLAPIAAEIRANR